MGTCQNDNFNSQEEYEAWVASTPFEEQFPHECPYENHRWAHTSTEDCKAANLNDDELNLCGLHTEEDFTQ